MNNSHSDQLLSIQQIKIFIKKIVSPLPIGHFLNGLKFKISVSIKNKIGLKMLGESPCMFTYHSVALIKTKKTHVFNRRHIRYYYNI